MHKTLPRLIFWFLCSNCLFISVAKASEQLKEAYRDAFMIGTALNEAIVAGEDKVSQNIVLKQFNAITPENVMKAGPINPQPGVYHFAPADAFVEFGEKHDMFIVGHTLIWHNQTPAWFFQDENGNPKFYESPITDECQKNYIVFL